MSEKTDEEIKQNIEQLNKQASAVMDKIESNVYNPAMVETLEKERQGYLQGILDLHNELDRREAKKLARI